MEKSGGPPTIGEDSYEAALRAADALFGTSKRKTEPQTAAPVRETMPTSPEQPGLEREPGSERTGRILRIIDEAPVQPTFADLEAARAPKKRGRKPGSKNKPKVAATVVTALESASAAEARDLIKIAGVAAPVANRTVAPEGARWRDRRFAWVRKTLRPGEAWKRRLPKVLW